MGEAAQLGAPRVADKTVQTGGGARAMFCPPAVPTLQQYDQNVRSLRTELERIIGDEPVRAKPEPLTSAQIAARLSVAEWSRVRAIFPFEANCRAIKAELRRRILAGQPTGISAVRTIEYIPAI